MKKTPNSLWVFSYFFVSFHWGMRVKKTNYIPFERGENFLSIGNKTFFSKLIYWRNIMVNIFCYLYVKKVRNVFEGILLFCHVVSFIDMVKIINYIQSGRAEEALSFGKKSFISVLFYWREIWINILCHYFCIVCYM